MKMSTFTEYKKALVEIEVLTESIANYDDKIYELLEEIEVQRMFKKKSKRDLDNLKAAILEFEIYHKKGPSNGYSNNN